MGITLSVLAMLCFASNILLTRYAVQRMPVESGFLVVVTTNIVFPFLLFLASFPAREVPFEWQWKGAFYFAIGGVIGTFLGRRFLFDAVKLLGPARASVFHSTAPVFALIGAWVLLDERLGIKEIALMAVVWTGLWLTQPPAGGAGSLTGETARKGLVAGILTVAGFGFGNTLRGVGMRSWDEAMFGTAIASAAAMVFQLAATREWPKIAAQFRAADARAYGLYIGCGIATTAGSIFISEAMMHIEIAVAALIVHTTPIVIFPVSVFLLGNREALTGRTLFGAVLVLAGIALLALRT